MKKESAFAFAFILVSWFFICFFKVVNPLFLPSPWRVAQSLGKLLYTDKLALDILRTMYRMAAGFTIGTCIGVPLGLLVGTSERVSGFTEPLVDFFRSIPVTALFPLFLVFFGIGDIAKVVIVAWSSSLIILVNTAYGVRSSRKTRAMVARTMGASSFQIFTKVVVFDALPHIVAGLRTALSLSLIVVIVTEMFMGTKLGIGQRIFNASVTYRTAEMYASIICAGLLGYFLNKSFVLVESRLVHWRGR